jgi:hypothetical protein
LIRRQCMNYLWQTPRNEQYRNTANMTRILIPLFLLLGSCASKEAADKSQKYEEVETIQELFPDSKIDNAHNIGSCFPGETLTQIKARHQNQGWHTLAANESIFRAEQKGTFSVIIEIELIDGKCP